MLGLPELFSEYLVWAASMLASRGIPAETVRRDMSALMERLCTELPGSQASIRAIMGPALVDLAAGRQPLPGKLLTPAGRRYLDAALHGGPIEASRVVDELVSAGQSIAEVYVDVLQAAMHEAGRLWQANRISVAEEHYCTAVTERVMAKLYSSFLRRRPHGASVVVACAPMEQHEMGARMVCDLLALEGYTCHYLGASVPMAAIADFVCTRDAALLALSAAVAPQVTEVRGAIELVRADERCRDVKIIVGGGIFNLIPGLWRGVGADAWAPDASSARAEVTRLIGPP
jgi:methanogenic corrinoid protein MtbC1